MKTINFFKLTLAIWMLLLFGLTTVQAQMSQSVVETTKTKTLKDKHGAAWPISKSGYVTKSQCLVCHGPYEKLAQKTQNLSPNPHNSHLGQVNCEDCHIADATKTNLMCNQCHNFKLKKN